MSETEILAVLSKAGAPAQTICAVMLVYLAFKLRAMDARLRAVAEIINVCPTCRRHANVVPLALLVGALVVVGCVQTRVKFGEAELSRTAVLTRVEVPSIEVATNGTFRASVKSDARTELLEAFLKALAAAK